MGTLSWQGFINDVSEKNFMAPLVTCSYIPLSHSSDRLKLWEFLGNGGRVGFVFYAAHNWSAHETSKKDGMLRGNSGHTNGVEDWGRQVAQVGPSAISCPPNIWNGLYALRNRCLTSYRAHGYTASGSEQDPNPHLNPNPTPTPNPDPNSEPNGAPLSRTRPLRRWPMTR